VSVMLWSLPNIVADQCSDRGEVTEETTFEVWNQILKQHAIAFSQRHEDCTVLFFSSYSTFSAFLDEPAAYGFPPQDVRRRAGAIWFDHLHPTSKVHDIIAHNLADFLADV